MARLDRIKNLTGLVEWYAGNPELRELTNLLVIGGDIDPDRSSRRLPRRAATRSSGCTG